jgi:hypothetical protein
MQRIMAWYYEILGRNDVVLAQSKPTYRTQWEAQWAGYRRFKDEISPTSGNKGGLRGVPVTQNIRAKHADD